MPVSVPGHGPISSPLPVLYFTFLQISVLQMWIFTGKTQAESEAEEAKSKQDLEAFTD